VPEIHDRNQRGCRVLPMAGMVLLVAMGGTTIGACSRSTTTTATTIALGPPPDPGVPSATSPYLHGLLSSPQGKFIRDEYGRVVILHGVNAVYKRPPYELFEDPGKPWNFTTRDAATIAGLGFNIVRLGIIWAGIEPGSLGANNPSICSKGEPTDPHQWNQAVADAYLANVRHTVDLLARYHVYTLLDMHEDVYSSQFHGEGAPSWALCTNGLPVRTLSGRWSNSYASPALNAAVHNFWTNDVEGDIQGEYDRAWAAVAATFKGDPWVAGYDPINEPFTTTLDDVGPEELDIRLECFYTGSAAPGRVLDGTQILDCPRSDPAKGLIPTILSEDPNHSIFREPAIFSSHGAPNYVGAMDYPNLVLNFHDYCGYRSGVTGNPYNLSACVAQEKTTFRQRLSEGPLIATSYEPFGLPLFMSEFGATQSSALLASLTRVANQSLIGWMYWSWKYYNDPTGSSGEALAAPSGQLHSIATVLSEPYPEAIAGSPRLINYDVASQALHIDFMSNPKILAPTLIFVPARAYPRGYCVRSTSGRVMKVGATIEVPNSSTAKTIDVTVVPGRCS
jgi:endoglycosylceramidase